MQAGDILYAACAALTQEELLHIDAVSAVLVGNLQVCYIASLLVDTSRRQLDMNQEDNTHFS